jgi:ABC-type Fe3+/spermidine/putrescine transport system ATPase subunit
MVRIEQLKATLGEFQLQDIDLDIRDREYFVVLGPTGAGKTVLLECIAGLTWPAEGRIWLGGRDVTALPPEQRQVGYLPQDYALFPHMTVRENLGFGLLVRQRTAEIPAKIARYAELLGIGHLLDRVPARLSGGEKQRVALGRALAIDPEIMLLDEPLSALDVATRERIGDELRRIHDSTGITSLHICHNFDETLRLADRVALMHQGRIVQVGTPDDILRRPNCLFAAGFVRSENTFAGVAAAAGPLAPIRLGPTTLLAAVPAPGALFVTIRPDDVEIEPPAAVGAAAPPNRWRATVERVEVRGDGYALQTAGALPITAFVGRPQWRRGQYAAGSVVDLHLPPSVIHAFPAAGADRFGTGGYDDGRKSAGDPQP